MFLSHTQTDYELISQEMATMFEVGDLSGWVNAKRDTQIAIACKWADGLIDEGHDALASALLTWVEDFHRHQDAS